MRCGDRTQSIPIVSFLFTGKVREVCIDNWNCLLSKGSCFVTVVTRGLCFGSFAGMVNS